MAPRPLLGDIELEKVQTIVVDGDQVLVEHGVPALEGDFLQRLGRRANQINLRGFLTGPEVADGLKTLRDKFRAAEPVPFVTDIATATQVGDVLIEEMGVRELAGKPERFEYALTLRQYVPTIPFQTEEPVVSREIEETIVAEAEDNNANITNQINVQKGTLIVNVEFTETDVDFSQINILVKGRTNLGQDFTTILTEQNNGVFRVDNIPEGKFTVSLIDN